MTSTQPRGLSARVNSRAEALAGRSSGVADKMARTVRRAVRGVLPRCRRGVYRRNPRCFGQSGAARGAVGPAAEGLCIWGRARRAILRLTCSIPRSIRPKQIGGRAVRAEVWWTAAHLVVRVNSRYQASGAPHSAQHRAHLPSVSTSAGTATDSTSPAPAARRALLRPAEPALRIGRPFSSGRHPGGVIARQVTGMAMESAYNRRPRG